MPPRSFFDGNLLNNYIRQRVEGFILREECGGRRASERDRGRKRELNLNATR